MKFNVPIALKAGEVKKKKYIYIRAFDFSYMKHTPAEHVYTRTAIEAPLVYSAKCIRLYTYQFRDNNYIIYMTVLILLRLIQNFELISYDAV